MITSTSAANNTKQTRKRSGESLEQIHDRFDESPGLPRGGHDCPADLLENRPPGELIREPNLTDRVHLLGERSDIARLVAALDIFSLSSSYGESFPVIVGEAMSCAVPCVVTDVGDSAWMISDTGRVVPPRDTHALASACQELLEIGPAGQALGAAARSRVTELFSLSSIVARYETLYQSSVVTAPAAEGKSGEGAFQSVCKNA